MSTFPKNALNLQPLDDRRLQRHQLAASPVDGIEIEGSGIQGQRLRRHRSGDQQLMSSWLAVGSQLSQLPHQLGGPIPLLVETDDRQRVGITKALFEVGQANRRRAGSNIRRQDQPSGVRDRRGDRILKVGILLGVGRLVADQICANELQNSGTSLNRIPPLRSSASR
jgi:hypothetical protein